MLQEVYRFRSIEKLITFKELERHEIYLALPQELNDPMEGYKDVTWRGDAILWENLLRHYILLLLYYRVQLSLVPTDEPFAKPHLPTALTADDLPTDSFRSVYEEACRDFVQRAGPRSLLAQLESTDKPLRREGLCLLLSHVHAAAIAAVTSTLHRHGLLGLNADHGAMLEATADKFAEIDKLPIGHDFEILATSLNYMQQNASLRALLAIDADVVGNRPRHSHFLFYEFTRHYVTGIVEKLLHPNWRTACFSGTCTNASSWAVYGDQHRGVALMFRPQVENERPFIPLVGNTGLSGTVDKLEPVRGEIKGFLHQVNYSDAAPEIEFFSSLGTLPRRKLELAWHVNREGRQSSLVSAMMAEDAVWRDAYWASFHRAATTKLEDWRHEQEYRIVLSSMLGVDMRLVQYDLNSLVGVVFGLRTTESDKAKIVKLVSQCYEGGGHPGITFYQMVYDAANRRLVRA